MPNAVSTRTPSYRKHKATDQAVVTLGGRDYYLGRHGTAASRAEYDRLIAEWLASGRQRVDTDGGLAVAELILAYWPHVESYYRKNGQPTSEVDTTRQALKPLRELYGRTPARDFGPLGLAAVRHLMIEKGWCRSYVNKQVSRVRHLFRWAASQELIPAEVYHGLQTVDGLRRGRCEAREGAPVKPVAEALINAPLPFMPAPVRAMVELQLLTAMRPGEVVIMRGCDLDVTGRVWTYRPQTSKSEHHGHERLIYIGPRAQEVLRPWLKTDLSAYLFSPAEAEAERNARKRAGRQTPRWPSHVKVQARKRQRRRPGALGEHYDVPAYRRAIARACANAFPPPEPLAKNSGESRANWKARLIPEERQQIRTWVHEHSWHPHQLRHNAATNLRREHGIELARIILGHANAFTTEIYAEADQAQAMEVVGKVG